MTSAKQEKVKRSVRAIRFCQACQAPPANHARQDHLHLQCHDSGARACGELYQLVWNTHSRGGSAVVSISTLSPPHVVEWLVLDRLRNSLLATPDQATLPGAGFKEDMSLPSFHSPGWRVQNCRSSIGWRQSLFDARKQARGSRHQSWSSSNRRCNDAHGLN